MKIKSIIKVKNNEDYDIELINFYYSIHSYRHYLCFQSVV